MIFTQLLLFWLFMWFYLIFNVSHPKIRGFANTHQGKKPQHKINLPCFSPLSMDAEWTKNRKAGFQPLPQDLGVTPNS